MNNIPPPDTTMANSPQSTGYIKESSDYGTSSTETPTTQMQHGLPTPLTATAPKFPSTFMEPLLSPMEEEPWRQKGKGKRRADDLEEPSQQLSMADPFAAPRIVQRVRHRRRNIANTIWPVEIGIAPPTPFSISRQPFNVYKALIRHPNLFFPFALRLPIKSIIHLYAIDKEFHYRLNKYKVSFIHDYAKYHAPLASYIFAWRMYPGVIISDPMLRPMNERPHLARDVPGFRWISMVICRENIVHGILTLLGLEGHRAPRGTAAALMKFWVLMELETSALRTAFLQDRRVWSDADILFFHMFLVKLDMRFSDPVLGNGLCELSRLLLTQKSMSLLYRILKGKKRLSYDDVSEMVIRTYPEEDIDMENHPWMEEEMEMNVPEEQCGLLCRENWSADGAPMDPALDMLVAEGLRRGVRAQQHLLDFVLYGYVDPKTGDNIPVPRKWRRDDNVVVPKTGWPRGRSKLSEKFDAGFEVEKVRFTRTITWRLSGRFGEGFAYVRVPLGIERRA